MAALIVQAHKNDENVIIRSSICQHRQRNVYVWILDQADIEMLKKTLATIVLFSTVSLAFADHAAQSASQKVIPMTNGSTLYIFKDNKMAMEDKFGRAIRMEKGSVMTTKNGEKILMQGDEVMRLDHLLKEGHLGG